MKLWTSPFRSVRTAVVVCAALAAGVSANSLLNEFAYDDLSIIVENEAIQSLETLPGAVTGPYWPDRYGQELGLWRPGTTALFGLQWAVFDGNPLGFHAVSLLLHVGVTALVVLLLARLLPLAAAFFGGLLFAVHPVHTEAVANVVGQSELAATALYLLACLVYLRASPDEKLGTRRVGAVCLLFGLAFSFKEMAATLPGALFLLDGARKELTAKDLAGYVKRRWTVYVGVVAVAAGILALRYQILGSVARPFAPLGADILEEIPRIWTVAGLWPHYVRLLFFPLDLSADYAPAVVPILFGWSLENVLGLAVALGFLGLAWAVWRESDPMSPEEGSVRAIGFGVVWFVVTISPVSNFFFLSGVLVAERSLYLPSVGFVLAAGWVLDSLRRERRRAGWALTGAVVVLMGLRTFHRNAEWRDNLTVFHVMVRDHPESGRSQWVLGDTHYARGDVRSALAAYRAAIGLLGTEYPLLTQIATRLAMSGHPEQAEILLRFAWNEMPELRQAPGLLAIVLSAQERHEEAEAAARVALEGSDLSDPVIHHVLSVSLAGQGRYREALAARRAVIRLGEDHPDQWRWLSQLHAQLGDTAQALQALDSAAVRVEDPDRMRQIDSLRAELQEGLGGL